MHLSVLLMDAMVAGVVGYSIVWCSNPGCNGPLSIKQVITTLRTCKGSLVIIFKTNDSCHSRCAWHAKEPLSQYDSELV